MKIKLAVFFGGFSVEHEVSIVTGVQAMHSVNRERYDVVPVYIAKDSRMYTGEPLFEIENYKNMSTLMPRLTQITLARDGNRVVMYRIPPKRLGSSEVGEVHVALTAVHGTNCEDGSLSGMFEMLRLPYAGCDVLSAAVSMDKVTQKHVLRSSGIPVVDFLSFHRSEFEGDEAACLVRIERELGYPVIVKPSNTGSSIGIKTAENGEELGEAVRFALSFSPLALVEHAVTSLREINCAVLGDREEAIPSVCEEPVGSDEILSFDDKYLASEGQKGMSGAKRKIPAELSPEVESEIKELAVETFRTIGCLGVARVDFLIDKANENRIYVNEINTVPGSLAFYLWEPAGVKYSELIDRLVSLAFKRERDRGKLVYSYESNILAGQGSKMGLKK